MNQESRIKNQEIENERVQRSFVFWFAMGLLLIVIDQISKWFVFRYGAEKVLYGFGISLFHNAQFAFSLPVPLIAMVVVYVGALLAIVIYIVKNHHHFTQGQTMAWVLICSGGISNVSERLVAGSVKDFLYTPGGGIFNFADVYIIGGILILLFIEYGNRPKRV